MGAVYSAARWSGSSVDRAPWRCLSKRVPCLSYSLWPPAGACTLATHCCHSLLGVLWPLPLLWGCTLDPVPFAQQPSVGQVARVDVSSKVEVVWADNSKTIILPQVRSC